MRQIVFLSGVFLFSSALLGQPEVPQLPKDLPPVLGIATATISEKESSVVKIKIVVPLITAEIRGEIVPKRGWPDAHVKTKQYEINIEIDPQSPSQLPGSEVLTSNGKPVAKDEILGKLKKPTPILLSITGRKVDPYYLQVVKSDTLVIILGPRDGSPNLDLMPQIKADK